MGRFYTRVISGRRSGALYFMTWLFLITASIAYRVVLEMRRLFVTLKLIRVKKLPVPVVSVGNLTMGGTGKTPCVEFLARDFSAKNLRTAIFSRGYGARAGSGVDDEALPFEDENIKRFTHRRKYKIYDTIVGSFNPDIVILDDGFQHVRLHRDIDIVLIDATNPFSNGWLFPAGMLREPLSGLARADVVILTHTDQTSRSRVDFVKDRVLEFNPAAAVLEAAHRIDAIKEVKSGRFCDLSVLQEYRFLGFCGVGNPISFRKTLHKIGAKVEKFMPFPDHHAFSARDYKTLNLFAREFMCDAFVTTTKDEMRLDAGQLDFPVYCVVVEFHIVEGGKILDAKIRHILEEYARHRGGSVVRQG